MKNIRKLLNTLISINIILGLAVIALFVLLFTGLGDSANLSNISSGDSDKGSSGKSHAPEDSVIEERIAVVKLDTLLAEYKLAQVLNENLIKRQKQAEANLQQKMSRFEKDYKNFQEKMRLGSFLSEASMQAQQQELMKQQQEIQELNQSLSMELAEEQERMTQGLYDSVLNHMPEINDGRFVLILGDAVGTNVLYSNNAMDITNEVVDFLNKKYEGRKEE
ncbi:MAG: OmpH family outer membrane protein [Bacteroidota bacterium]|nr:OmpH family outer membrane protein [Bacteroidota bacterium]